MTADPPLWAAEYVRKWRGLLYLQAWAIKITLSPTPDGDTSGKTKACVEVYPDVFQAVITLSDQITASPDPYWEQTILHEMIHILFGRLQDFFDRSIWPLLHTGIDELAAVTLKRELEPLVELLAQILHEYEEAGNEDQ